MGSRPVQAREPWATEPRRRRSAEETRRLLLEAGPQLVLRSLEANDATGGGPLASYYCGRNFLRVIARDMPGPLLAGVWPHILVAQLRMAAESFRHIREPAARAKLRGQLDGLRELPRLLGERRAIQARRRVPIRYLRSIMATP